MYGYYSSRLRLFRKNGVKFTKYVRRDRYLAYIKRKINVSMKKKLKEPCVFMKRAIVFHIKTKSAASVNRFLDFIKAFEDSLCWIVHSPLPHPPSSFPSTLFLPSLSSPFFSLSPGLCFYPLELNMK